MTGGKQHKHHLEGLLGEAYKSPFTGKVIGQKHTEHDYTSRKCHSCRF